MTYSRVHILHLLGRAHSRPQRTETPFRGSGVFLRVFKSNGVERQATTIIMGHRWKRLASAKPWTRGQLPLRVDFKIQIETLIFNPSFTPFYQ